VNVDGPGHGRGAAASAGRRASGEPGGTAAHECISCQIER
jgi:hypothetical protein